MKLQPAAFLRTTLPLGIDSVEGWDDGRYHSVWLPDHMVSFWPDSIWTPEFTDLAKASPSPHRHLDAMAVAGSVAVKSTNLLIATHVVDTVRRHPAMLAQTALTLSHLSKGRFILGLGCGELENTVPYGFDFEKPVARYEEALKVIKLLWDADGPVNFEGRFFRLEHARMDTEFFDGKAPPIWAGAAGPRMLRLAGQYADGWWPAGAWTPEDYAAKLQVILREGEKAGRDMSGFVAANNQICLIGDEGELEEILQAPLVKSVILMLTGKDLLQFGHKHPMGDDWGGVMDFDPVKLSRDKMVRFCAEMSTQAIRDIFPVGTPAQVARKLKGFVDAGMRVFKVMDYGGMAGMKYGAGSAAKIRAVEDELLRICS